MSSAKVELSNVAVRYGSNAVLHDVSLTIEPGEFFALLGPSGSGKSTLLRLVAGFVPAHAGGLRIAGIDVSAVPPWQRGVGMVFQNYALWPHMTVQENVAFGLEERRLPARVVAEKVRAALGLVNLVEYAARRPSQLSGGQQQRVALARTIAVEPKVLLLDEPLSNLDAKLRIRMREELRALQRKLGITTIFVTHDQEEAMTTADRIAVMDQGVIQQVGSAMEIFDNPANRFVANFVGSINLLPSDSPLLRQLALAAAGGAEVVIRPHTIVLAAARGGAGHHWLNGTVVEREFLGAFIRYTVKVGEQRLVAEEPHRIGRESHRPGDTVHLGIDPAQVRLLNSITGGKP
jgi:iron(III) transport system ATP-binding protein